MTDIDVRKNLFELNQQAIEDDLTPFGFIDNGMNTGWDEDDEFRGGELVTSFDLDYDRESLF